MQEQQHFDITKYYYEQSSQNEPNPVLNENAVNMMNHFAKERNQCLRKLIDVLVVALKRDR
jgi:hypothetical protein